MGSRFSFLERAYETDRLCALTDGIYAIALTLLVLDLKVPEVPGITNPELRSDLFQQRANFVAYGVAFILLSFFWINHHRIFHLANRCDGRALVLNLFHLLFVSLTPYVTSLIGHYGEDRIAVNLFNVNLGFAAGILAALATYVLGKKEWRIQQEGGQWVAIPRWVIFAGPGLVLISIPLSFISHTAALCLGPIMIGGYMILLRRNGKVSG